MSEKVTGYILLLIGVIIILLAFLNGYGLFSGVLQPVQLFNFSGLSIDLGVSKQEVFSGRDLSQSTNFFLHLIMLGFFLNVGFKLSTLGTQLLRPIKVEIKDNKVIQ